MEKIRAGTLHGSKSGYPKAQLWAKPDEDGRTKESDPNTVGVRISEALDFNS